MCNNIRNFNYKNANERVCVAHSSVLKIVLSWGSIECIYIKMHPEVVLLCNCHITFILLPCWSFRVDLLASPRSRKRICRVWNNLFTTVLRITFTRLARRIISYILSRQCSIDSLLREGTVIESSHCSAHFHEFNSTIETVLARTLNFQSKTLAYIDLIAMSYCLLHSWDSLFFKIFIFQC